MTRPGIFSRAPFKQRAWSDLEVFAAQVAVAIANARAFEQIESLREALKQENARFAAELVDRQLVEAALRESEQQFRSVAQSAPNAIITADQTDESSSGTRPRGWCSDTQKRKSWASL